jgi:kynureninase
MIYSSYEPSLTFARRLDQEDEIFRFREEFYMDSSRIYLDGNSLGLLSKRAERAVMRTLEDWKIYAIDGWSEGERPWYYLAEKLGQMMAPLVGALPKEVIVTASTTVNLHQLTATFYEPKGKRTKILADELTFPSDLYALQSQLRLRGYDPAEHLVLVKSRDERYIQEEDIIRSMTDDIALIVLPTVLYRSGQLLNIERLTREARARGIPVGFDACHSVGAIPHLFHQWDVDFAFWCTYKYLNSGPGGVGALYVNEKHFDRLPGMTGWFGSQKEKQFDLEPIFTPAENAGAFQIATPHVLSMAPLLGSLEMFQEAGIHNIRRKSLELTRYMMDAVQYELQSMGFAIGSPSEEDRRGGHVSLEHPEAARICKAMKENGIVPDFRAPHSIRLAPVAMYTSFVDVWHAIQKLKRIMTEKQYEKFENKRGVIA